MKKIFISIVIVMLLAIILTLLRALPDKKSAEEMTSIHYSGKINQSFEQKGIEVSFNNYEYTDKAELVLPDIEERYRNKPCLSVFFTVENDLPIPYDVRIHEADVKVNGINANNKTNFNMSVQADSKANGVMHIFPPPLGKEEVVTVEWDWISFPKDILENRIDHNMSIDITF